MDKNEKLVTQWAFGEPSREAQVASVNTSCQIAIKTLRANLKFNPNYLTIDTLRELSNLENAIVQALDEKQYGPGKRAK